MDTTSPALRRSRLRDDMLHRGGVSRGRSAPRTRLPWLLCGVLAVALSLAWPGAATAQEGLTSVPAAAPRVGEGVSPGGAFLRAVLVPGWGHASIGSWGRGAFYFVAEGLTAYGLVRTRLRLSEARDRAAFREDFLRTRAAADGLSQEELETLLEEDDALDDLNGLVGARKQQQEDWVAFGIFLLFLSGADAYVSAHLKDFPAPIEVDVRPAGQGRTEFSVGVRLPR